MFMIIKGYASVYNIKDYHNDIIKSGAFCEEVLLFKNNNKNLLLLAHHNTLCPIGKITQLEEDSKGLYIEAIIDKNPYNEDIVYFLEKNFINDLSIGIIPLDYKNEKDHRVIKKAKLLEVSLVTIGANPLAKIQVQ